MKTQNNCPSVLILISTDIIGGPGKGILQLTGELHKRKDTEYRIGVFKLEGQKETQFIEKSGELGRNLDILIQKNAFDFSVIKQILKVVDKHNINILQTHGYKENIIGFIVTRMRPALKWINVLHGWTAENKKMQVYHYLDKICLRFSDTMIAVSDALMEQFIDGRAKKKRSKVILNAIHQRKEPLIFDPALMPAGIFDADCAEKPFVWSAIGRLTEDKGHSFLIKAFAMVAEKDPNQRLLIVGDGPQYQPLINLVKELNIEHLVYIAGYQKNVEPYYAATDVMVLSSIAFEGLPNVLLEALNNGIPVISTPVTGVSEVIIDNENGWMVPIADSNALAEKMLHVKNNTNDFLRIKGKTQQSIFPKFSVQKRVDSFVDEYENLINN